MLNTNSFCIRLETLGKSVKMLNYERSRKIRWLLFTNFQIRNNLLCKRPVPAVVVTPSDCRIRARGLIHRSGEKQTVSFLPTHKDSVLWEPSWPINIVLGLRAPDFEFRILCKEGGVIWFHHPLLVLLTHNLFFYPPEVVSRYRDPQLQVGKITSTCICTLWMKWLCKFCQCNFTISIFEVRTERLETAEGAISTLKQHNQAEISKIGEFVLPS